MDKIDRRYITTEFLKQYFPDPDRFKASMANPPGSLEYSAKQRYLACRDGLNLSRRKSGKPPLSDADLAEIIRYEEGLLNLPRPNKHI